MDRVRRIIFATVALASVSGLALGASPSSTSSPPSTPSRSYSSPPPSRSYSPPPSSSGFSKPASPPPSQSGFSKPPAAPQQSSGFTKPATPPPEATQAPQQSSGFTKPVAPPPQSGSQAGFTKPNEGIAAGQGGFSKPGTTPPPSPAFVPRSAADTMIAKGQSKTARAQFQQEQERFKSPPVAAPSTQQAAQQSSAWRQYGGTRWRSSDDYWTQRRRAEQQLPPNVQTYYTSPPSWVSPAIGSFAGAWLGSVLANAGNSQYDHWAYSHRNDADYQTWHRQMEDAAKDNAELRKNLDVLDAKVAELEKQKAPATEKLPDGVDPSLVVAPQTVLLATASSGTNWWIWGPLIGLLCLAAFFAVCLAVAFNRRSPRYG